MTYTAHVITDLYHAGYSWDGQSFHAEQYYVVIENDRGRRFSHTATFKGTQRFVCDETGEPCFPDRREEARTEAERLCARVNAALEAGTDLDPDYWVETDPAYGSEEYIAQGTEAQRAFAERQEG